MEDSLDHEAVEIGIRFRDDRQANDRNLKARFEDIFQKYERDFTGVGDEIDLWTGKIIVNNGHLKRMQHEVDPGHGAASSFITDLTLEDSDESGEATPGLDDDTDLEHALQELGREIDDLSDYGGSSTDDDSEEEVDVVEHSNDGVTVDNDALGACNAPTDSMESQIRVLQDMPSALRDSILAMQTKDGQFDERSLQQLEKSITEQIAQFLAASAGNKVYGVTEPPPPVKDMSSTVPSKDSIWSYPELPEERDQLLDSPQALKAALFRSSAGTIESPEKSRSLWAPLRPRGRPLNVPVYSQSDADEDEFDHSLLDMHVHDTSLQQPSPAQPPSQHQTYAANTARRIAPKETAQARSELVDYLRARGGLDTSKQQHPSMYAPDSENQNQVVREALKALQTPYVQHLAQQRHAMLSQTDLPNDSKSGKLYTKQEDELMIDLHCRKGLPWNTIRDYYLPKRSLESLLNRWTYVRRRILGDLIVKGDISADNIKPLSRTTQQAIQNDEHQLSTSYRADALRRSLLGKTDVDTEHMGSLETNTHDVPHRDLAETIVEGYCFTQEDDVLIRRLRDEEMLLFSEIAEYFPKTVDELTITERYYSHILGKTFFRTKSTLQTVGTRSYLVQEVFPEIRSFHLDPESAGKLKTLLPAPLPVETDMLIAPAEARTGPLTSERKLLKRTRRRKTKAYYQMMKAKKQAEAEAETQTSQDKHPGPSVVDGEECLSFEDRESLTGLPTPETGTPPDQTRLPQQQTRSQPCFPSSIPDTEDEALQSSNPVSKIDRGNALVKANTETPRLSIYDQHRLSHLDPKRSLNARSTGQQHAHSADQEHSSLAAPSAIPSPGPVQSVSSQARVHCILEARDDFVRSSTPVAEIPQPDMVAVSPTYRTDTYGTPARWRQQALPYYVQERPTHDSRGSTQSYPVRRDFHSTTTVVGVPVQTTSITEIDSMLDTSTIRHMNSMTAATELKPKPRKRKSLDSGPINSARHTTEDSEAVKKVRTTLGVVTNGLDDVSRDDMTEDGKTHSAKLSTNDQPAGRTRHRTESIGLTSDGLSRAMTGLTRSEPLSTDIATTEAGTILLPPTPSSQERHRTSTRTKADNKSITSTSRAIIKPKGRLSDLKGVQPARRSLSPLSKASARPPSEAAFRRMSTLVDELSDDELA